MEDKKSNISSRLTFLVFKDNFTSRAFNVSLRWVKTLGVVVGILFFAAAVGGGLALKYYLASRDASPARVEELEQELAGLKIAILKQQGVTKVPESTMPSETLPSPVSSPVASGKKQGTSAPVFSSGLTFVDPQARSIGIYGLMVGWQGQSVNVNFALQYQRQDGGNQQGKIVILAHGRDSLFSYPAGALNPLGSPRAIAFEKGEFFSVSRFRAVKARFGPVASYENIREIEIFIFDEKGDVLISEKVKPSATLPPEPTPTSSFIVPSSSGPEVLEKQP